MVGLLLALVAAGMLGGALHGRMKRSAGAALGIMGFIILLGGQLLVIELFSID